MPQSLTQNYVHLVFSTKHREPLLFSPVKEEVWAYIGGICNKHECSPVSIGGYTDHVHILCLLSKKIALMKLVEVIKSNSSRWIKSRGKDLEHFSWQDGYGAFSVGQVQLELVKAYIQNQEEHHKAKGFQDEFRTMLKKYRVEYNEQWVWD